MKVLGMSVMRGMCDGLGMTPLEWEGMRAMVNDSFWVMRVIGTWRGSTSLTRDSVASHHHTIILVVVVFRLVPWGRPVGLSLSLSLSLTHITLRRVYH